MRATCVICKGIVCRGEERRTWPVFEERFLPRWLLGRRGILLQKLWLQAAKQWTQMQMNQEVFSLANVSSLEGCDIKWIGWEEGSERPSMSLVCSSVTGVEVARMNAMY